MRLKKRIRKIIKWGPWSYRFWRELMRRPYEIAFPTPAIADDILSEFPEAAELRDKYPELRAEALKISMGRELPANHEIMAAQTTFYDFDKIPWRMANLRAYGFDYPDNMAEMPIMADFLRRNPHVVSATISVFPAGKHLRPHRGPWKGVWRYHLPYLVQDLGDGRTSCELMIDGRDYFLKEGEDMLWDDTFMHSATNRSDTPRIVLLLDVYRKNHPWWLNWISRGVLGAARIGQRTQGMRAKAAIGT
ncbi:aspartyl/asparaginyl beta-hydroxylase domain-containing protein [Oceanibium sediminis]|uniref:aspartyl/asparaginyl beta-hydroxylase domain-containing protein n=1 Tax=Oceanibium sediminis TaxID=2026339 RepID=UPI000DD3BF09|nr:aspartyl/asparaginyl beta-hydroxylase domain-containing protein [Oceanibium sediminis]